MALWVFMRTWEKGTFHRVALAVTDRFAVNDTRVVIARVGCGCCGWFGVHRCCFWWVAYVCRHLWRIFGKWVQSQAVEYLVFDLRLLKRCLQKVPSSVFGSSDPFSLTEFIVTRLKGAEHHDWVMSRSSLRHAIISGELSMPSLVEVVSNIVGVWLLIVVYLKETGRKTNADSLMVYYILHL